VFFTLQKFLRQKIYEEFTGPTSVIRYSRIGTNADPTSEIHMTWTHGKTSFPEFIKRVVYADCLVSTTEVCSTQMNESNISLTSEIRNTRQVYIVHDGELGSTTISCPITASSSYRLSQILGNSSLDISIFTPHHVSAIRKKNIFKPELQGARGSVVGWGSILQAGRSRVRFSMRSLDIPIDIILPAALWPWGRLSV
jgi:hypothetical protein